MTYHHMPAIYVADREDAKMREPLSDADFEEFMSWWKSEIADEPVVESPNQ